MFQKGDGRTTFRLITKKVFLLIMYTAKPFVSPAIKLIVHPLANRYVVCRIL